ncbi:MAG: DUF3990 domain-containing protein [Phycisphaerales bacterium JB054]
MDYISIKNRQVFWVIEEDGIFNRDVDRILLGLRNGSEVNLIPTFGGGTVGLKALRGTANSAWSHGYRFAELYAHSKSTAAGNFHEAVGQIRSMLDDLRGGKALDQQGKNPTGWVDVAESAHEGYVLGVKSTGLTLADSLTFGFVDELGAANDQLWEESGLAGTWYETGSRTASRVGVEAAIAAGTLGAGSALSGARADGQVAQAGSKGSRVVQGTKAFLDTARSPLAQQVGQVAAGSGRLASALRAGNTAARAWEAVDTVVQTQQGIQAVMSGNYWGALQVLGGGISGLGAVAGGYGAARRAMGGSGILASGSTTGRLVPGQVARNAAAAWKRRTRHDLIRFYHGTDEVSAAAIRQKGIDLSMVRANLDFSRTKNGFYLAESRAHAASIAKGAAKRQRELPQVITYRVKRQALERFRMMDFGSDTTSDWVKFVRYNRDKIGADQLPSHLTNRWWDVVRGRTAAQWDPTVVPLRDWIQLCITTPEAVKLFNKGIR